MEIPEPGLRDPRTLACRQDRDGLAIELGQGLLPVRSDQHRHPNQRNGAGPSGHVTKTAQEPICSYRASRPR